MWLFNPVVPKGHYKKFHKPWTGPHKVLSKLSDSTYSIKHTRRPFRTKVVHFDRLKPCRNDICFPLEELSRLVGQPSQTAALPTPIGTNVEIIDAPEPVRRYMISDFIDLEYRIFLLRGGLCNIANYVVYDVFCYYVVIFVLAIRSRID